MRETSQVRLRTLFFSQYVLYDVADEYVYWWFARQCAKNLFSCSAVMIFISLVFLSFPPDVRNILLNNIILSQAVQYLSVLAREQGQCCHYAFLAAQETLPVLRLDLNFASIRRVSTRPVPQLSPTYLQIRAYVVCRDCRCIGRGDGPLHRGQFLSVGLYKRGESCSVPDQIPDGN